MSDVENIRKHMTLCEGEVVPFVSKYEPQIKSIMNAPVTGDAYQDAFTMSAIDDLIFDPKAPMALKIKALEKMDEILGYKGKKSTAQDVENYINGTL